MTYTRSPFNGQLQPLALEWEPSDSLASLPMSTMSNDPLSRIDSTINMYFDLNTESRLAFDSLLPEPITNIDIQGGGDTSDDFTESLPASGIREILEAETPRTPLTRSKKTSA